MNPEVILALIADLYQQVGVFASENERLRAALPEPSREEVGLANDRGAS